MIFMSETEPHRRFREPAVTSNAAWCLRLSHPDRLSETPMALMIMRSRCGCTSPIEVPQDWRSTRIVQCSSGLRGFRMCKTRQQLDRR
jgi:hypothetical protein